MRFRSRRQHGTIELRTWGLRSHTDVHSAVFFKASVYKSRLNAHTQHSMSPESSPPHACYRLNIKSGRSTCDETTKLQCSHRCSTPNAPYTAHSQPSFARSAIDDQFYRHAWRLHVNLPLDSPMNGYSGVFSREADLTRLAGLARVVSLRKPSPWAGQPLRPDAHLEAASRMPRMVRRNHQGPLENSQCVRLP